MPITSEARFVTLSTREHDASTSQYLQQASQAVRDWDEVVNLATRHRVAAFVRDAVTREGIIVPEKIRAALRQAVLNSLLQALTLNAGLRQAISRMATFGVSPMVLKGPVLAPTIYPEPVFRPYGDIDLNVLDRDEALAVNALLDLGYVELPDLAEEQYRQHGAHVHEHQYHRQFMSADRNMVLELHTDPLQLGLRPSCETERWSRAIPAPSLPNAVMLCPEDQLVQLSVHVHKHGFDRLIWLKDIDLLVRKHRHDLDWRLILDVARKEGVRGSVWYTLELASRLLSTPPIPRYVTSRLRPSLAIRALYRLVWPPSKMENLGGQMHRRAVQVRGADSWRGVLPSLILMERRRDRARVALHLLGRR